jgi:hypothetical protein
MKNIIRECLATAFAEKQKATIPDWALDNIRLRESPYGNQFRATETPWLLEPLTAFADPNTEEVVLNCAAQTGKTVSMQVAIAWALANHPGPTMTVMQDEDAAKDFSKERLMPMLESCATLRRQFPTDRHKKTNTEIFLTTCTLKLGAANNNFLRSWSIRWLFGDEVSAWKPGMLARARARTTRYWNRKHWLSSTPEEEGSDFDGAYKAGTCEHWHLKCIGCSELFMPAFYDCLQWDTNDTTKPNGVWDFEALSETVRMVCPHCGHQHENTETNWRAMSKGGYIATNDNPTPRVRSFSFNQLALPPSVMPWADLVVDFLQAKQHAAGGYIQPLREFVTLRLAEPWKATNHVDIEKVVVKDYEPSAEWADEATRFLTVDVQAYLEEFWAVARSWSKTGASRLLSFRRLTSFDEIEAMRKEFNIAPQRTFLDVGYQRARVLAECGRYGWMGMRGEDTTDYAHSINGHTVRRMFSKPTRVSATGRTAPPVFRWSNPTTKDVLQLLKSGKSHPWEVCDLGEMADEYAKQIDSERKKEVLDKHGRTTLRWVSFRANHGWDCELMQVVAASIAKLFSTAE